MTTQLTPSDNRPNIVLILADDLGCGDISLYDGWVRTPRIDAMAREGVTFTDIGETTCVADRHPERVAEMAGAIDAWKREGVLEELLSE